MLKTKKLYTYEDYAELPDDKRYELIWGEFFMSPSPDIRHQALLRALGKLILAHVEANDLGTVYYAPCDVVLDKHDTVQPDILFVSHARAKIIGEKNIQGAPDLAVEIVSPGTEERDKLIKKNLYEEHGVREYWIVDPQAGQITVYTLKRGRYDVHAIFEEGDELTSVVLPGLKIAVTPLLRLRR